ncbi:hypothetical protein OESDEN_10218 [Oesophagostomum dentatum]|uniref:Uncharacterized protein n=1 Tax=Oesophagostomum dentatum TaxID=61180 RepID=A0A0B1SXA8_OESDE|nr:hypothetical protein OESDEN_10218 [Oesophagostomum dentatum]
MVEKHLNTKIKDDTLMFKFVFEQNGAEEVYVAIGGAEDVKAKVVSFKGKTGKTLRLRQLTDKLLSCERKGPAIDFKEFKKLVKAN